MDEEGTTSLDPPRYRIERARRGYRVIGPRILIWEPTLGEAQERREELENGRWAWALGSAPRRREREPFSLVYGPVASRRLGRSLGVDLTPPGCRLCTFDCVYCEWTDLPRPRGGVRWPAPDEIAAALDAALQRERRLDSVTLSGHGEPTLHPRFPEVVDAVLDAVARSRAEVPVRILTNAARVAVEPVRRALDRLDERIVKLDADAQLVNRPQSWRPIVDRVFDFSRLRDVTLQSCFVAGAVSNVEPGALRVWTDLVSAIRPRGVQIYTIDAQPAASGILPVGAAQLEEIACELRARTGIEARVYA